MQAYTAADLAASFRTVRKNTIQIAEDIPENRYSFEPSPGSRSISELLRHILYSPMIQDDMHRITHVVDLSKYDFPAVMAKSEAAEAEPKTKAEIVAALKSEGDKFAAWLESLSPEFLAERMTGRPGAPDRSRLDSLLSVKEHEMHHRGQLMLIERLIGIVPHLTRAREEHMRQREAAAAAAAAAAIGAGV